MIVSVAIGADADVRIYSPISVALEWIVKGLPDRR